jgi:hypothetical protein
MRGAARGAAMCAAVACFAAVGAAQSPRPLMPIDFVHSAEFAWLAKPVHDRRVLDDLTRPDAWKSSGTATVTFPREPRLGDEVFEGPDGAKIFIDRKSHLFLDGTTLDYDTALLTQGFVFHNPNAKQTCGCGSSFGA